MVRWKRPSATTSLAATVADPTPLCPKIPLWQPQLMPCVLCLASYATPHCTAVAAQNGFVAVPLQAHTPMHAISTKANTHVNDAFPCLCRVSSPLLAPCKMHIFTAPKEPMPCYLSSSKKTALLCEACFHHRHHARYLQ